VVVVRGVKKSPTLKKYDIAPGQGEIKINMETIIKRGAYNLFPSQNFSLDIDCDYINIHTDFLRFLIDSGYYGDQKAVDSKLITIYKTEYS
jgi:hypothetical protein